MKGIEPLPSQSAFAQSRAPFPALVAGYGSGKTTAAVLRCLALKTQFREQDIAYYLPTYGLIRDIAIPKFEELMDAFGVPYTINRVDSDIRIPGAGKVMLRTMDSPERIVGYEVGHSIIDELDTLPVAKARSIWNKVIARNRQVVPGFHNTVGVVTTPEGFRFVHEAWVKSPGPGHVLYRARTADNPHLPPGYLDSLMAAYPEALRAAYLDGQFVNLAAGSVYPEFDRSRHRHSEQIRPGEPLHIGVDFNVTRMAAVVFVLRDDNPLIVAEHVGLYDTPELVRVLGETYPGHPILIYPDASGGGRQTVNAAQSDLAIIRGAGFSVRAHKSNPAVRDRIAAVNRMFRDDRMFINTDACPHLTEALEQQPYTPAGEPDKSGGLDHVLDAMGYMVAYRYPVVERPAFVWHVSA